jgi:hypothetical protein
LAITHGWLNVANTLDAQGETSLASEVRHFARHLPRVLTDKEHVAVAILKHLANTQHAPPREHTRESARDLTR